MNAIKDNISKITQEIPKSCTLVAVSKTKPNDAIIEAYNSGHRDFGENKVQELSAKAEALPKDIRWHMIGHLQRNKVKYIAPYVHLIHGVDTVKLLAEINKQALKNERTINCLLQIHIATEQTKFGFDEAEFKSLITTEELEAMKNVKIVGLMGMATNTEDTKQINTEFQTIERLFNWLKKHTSTKIQASVLSTGMSGDYQIAIQNGSTMVRIGSAIFGPRNYH